MNGCTDATESWAQLLLNTLPVPDDEVGDAETAFCDSVIEGEEADLLLGTARVESFLDDPVQDIGSADQVFNPSCPRRISD